MKNNPSITMTTDIKVNKSVTRSACNLKNVKTAKQADKKCDLIHTKPGLTRDGKPFDHVVQKRVDDGEYRLQTIPADITGTLRPIEVYRATRAKNNIIKPWNPQTEDDSYCPAYWCDIAIGRGACGFRCRACFLNLTHRCFCDPSRTVLYENIFDYAPAVL
jgi:hypothetical protein